MQFKKCACGFGARNAPRDAHVNAPVSACQLGTRIRHFWSNHQRALESAEFTEAKYLVLINGPANFKLKFAGDEKPIVGAD